LHYLVQAAGLGRRKQSRDSPIKQKETTIMIFDYFTGSRMVEGLGDEEIPWWIAPYVRDFAALAQSTAVLGAARQAAQGSPEPALVALAQRISQTAAVARIAVRMKGGEALNAAVGSALSAEIDEYCGTPPRPHHLNQAALAVSLVASSLSEKDAAKAVLIAEAERLQGLTSRQQASAA
jgi:hypothetical protein